MPSRDIASYKNLYLQTAKEYIDSLSISCSKLTDNPQDIDAINSLHVSSHSLKSQSQVMGFTNVANLSAAIEEISKAALEGGNQINNNLIPVLRESVKELSLCLFQIEKKNEEMNLQPIINKLDAEINSA